MSSGVMPLKGESIMDDIKKGFTQGFVYACAQLIRDGEEYRAEWLWNESGFSEKDLKYCDDYDAKEIRKYLKQWA